jgi:hypothetical protein
LNDALARGDAATLQSLFGAAQPLTVEWLFEATNLATKKPIVVTRAPASRSPNGVHVVETERSPGRIVLDITFPDGPDALHELEATATITDSLGGKTRVTRRVWSHSLGGTSRDSLVRLTLPVIAGAAGIPIDRLMRASEFGTLGPTDRRLRDSFVRRSLIVHNATRQAVMDDRITIAELSVLIRGASRLGQ